MTMSDASRMVAFMNAFNVGGVGVPRRDDVPDDKLDALAGAGVEGLEVSVKERLYRNHPHENIIPYTHLCHLQHQHVSASS